jgi:DNA-binding response OmpR family regulator
MSGAQHIVVVDNETSARQIVGNYLRMHGFAVLSIMRDIKQRTRVPVVMLTATASPIDRVVGLELGADDYLAKPCELRELVARVRSLLRRSAQGLGASPSRAPPATPAPAARQRTTVRFGTKWLDLDARTLCDDHNNEHPLTASEFVLLKACRQSQARDLARAAARPRQCARSQGVRPGDRRSHHPHSPQDRT